MNKNIFIIILISLLMLSSLNVLAITYGKTGAETDFTGDVNIPLGSNYHRDEIPLSFIQSRNNATVPPTADDDSADGYEVNSVWTDIVGDRTYICVDATEGDAIWSAPFTMWVRADEAIAKGDPVYISGSLGAARPLVKLVDADLEVAHHMIGAAVEDIAFEANGFIRTSGAIKSVDTEGVTDANPGNEDWTPGDHLYATLDGNGGYTNVRPTSGMVILAAFTLLGDHDNDTILVVAHVNDSDMAAAAGEDIRIRLGADDGSTDMHIKNFSDVLVASINDKGVGQFKTTITTKSGVATITTAEAGLILVSAGSDYTLTLPTASGNMGLTYKFVKTDYNYNLITLDGNGGETFNYENAASSPQITYPRLNTPLAEVTIVSDGTNWQVINEAMGQVPRAYAYIDVASTDQLNLIDHLWTCVEVDATTYNIGNNFDTSTWVSGDMTSYSANHLVDSGANFSGLLVGKRIENTDDGIYAYVTARNSATDLTLSADIFDEVGAPWDGYEVKNAHFTIPVSGMYFISNTVQFRGGSVVANKQYTVGVYKNHTLTAGQYQSHSSNTGYLTLGGSFLYNFAASDKLELFVLSDADVDTVDIARGTMGANIIIKLISKD